MGELPPVPEGSDAEPRGDDQASRELVQKASRGDAASIGALLERHLPRLEAFVRLRMGPELRAYESSADLVQSACREVLEGLERYEYRGESEFRGWLFTTALHKVSYRVRHLRARRRDARRAEPPPNATLSGPGDPLAGLAAAAGTPSEDAMAREELARLERAFALLPEHYREVIALARIAGLAHREIAAQLGKTEEATRVLLFRALAALAKVMRPEGG